ncbi:MAG: helix-turn-helix domain-containing protein [Elusimicrobia bacterium]|nr:helix-turn-helix domain-containing protein [Elusimicrobiota bacterium]
MKTKNSLKNKKECSIPVLETHITHNTTSVKIREVFHHIIDATKDYICKISRHSHSFHELIIVLKGSMYVEILKKEICAKAGDILFYHAGVFHKERFIRGNEIICISWEEQGKIKFPILMHDASGKIRFLAKWLWEQDKSNYSRKVLLQEKTFEIIKIELARICESGERHFFVSNLKSFMAQDLNKSMTLKNMANYVCLSEDHLLKKYKKLTGHTPMEDLRIIRLETAKSMVLHTRLPLKAIAYKVGFHNVYLFSRLFKKYFKLPPGYFHKDIDYRKHTVFSKS